MIDLQSLFNDAPASNPGCIGCPILKTDKQFFCKNDWDDLGQHNVLFLTESFVGKLPIPYNDRLVIEEILDDIMPEEYVFSPSVKCPSVKEATMSTEAKHICRKYVYETVSKVKPKLIYCLGNLAFNMLTKKSGVNSKHGEIFTIIIPNGEEYRVVPLFHPYTLQIEPASREVFIRDIKTAYDRVVKENVKTIKLDYEFISNPKDLVRYRFLTEKSLNRRLIAFDVETTGLNFLTDKIHTAALSWKHNDGYKQICYPIEHKECNLTREETKAFLRFTQLIIKQNSNAIVAQKGKFDIKMIIAALARYDMDLDVLPHLMYDTKLIEHLLDEESERNLHTMVKKYFPLELGDM